MKVNNYLSHIAAFLIGCAVTYTSLQFVLFDVNFELDIVNFFMSIVGLLVAIYIAHNIQNALNAKERKNSFLSNKIENLWDDFNQHTENFIGDNYTDVSAIHQYQKDCVHSAVYLINIYESFQLDKSVCESLLESMEQLENFISNIPADNNRIDLTEKSDELKVKINSIHALFAEAIALFI